LSKLIAYKSNALIEASYKLTLQEQRVLLMCIGKLNPQDKNPKKQFQLTADEFYLAFPDMNRKHAERRLQEAIDRLWERSIIINWKDKSEKIRWIQGQAKYFSGEGKIEIVFSDLIMPYLTQLKGQFTSITVKNISALKSTYSIRIYELLMQFKKTGNRLINIDDFRSILSLDKKYKEFRTLNNSILKRSLKELNAKSDLIVSVEYIKKGRSIIALQFQFKEDKQIKIIS